MSGGRPSLAKAFAPATSRGVKLEGMLAPKRERREVTSGNLESTPADKSRTGEPTSLMDVGTDTGVVHADNPSNGSRQARSIEKPTASGASLSTVNPKQQAGKKATVSKTKASQTVPGAPRNVGVYLEPALLATVKEAVHSARVTYADLLLEAFEALDPESIVREFRPATMPTASGMPRRAVRQRGSAGIQIQVRLDDDQVAWLDEKVIEFGAPSRSALVSTAFKLHVAD
jgi:hypothetical protein